MRKLFTLFLVLGVSSCIPIKIAPKIENYKVLKARRFEKSLKTQYAFVFKDSKEADQFYHYINTRFELDHHLVDTNVPVLIQGNRYYLSFLEREKVSETGNLVPILLDGILSSQDVDPVFESAYSSRSSHWYLILLLENDDFQDVLHPEHPEQQRVLPWLEALKAEYLNTANFNELSLKN